MSATTFFNPLIFYKMDNLTQKDYLSIAWWFILITGLALQFFSAYVEFATIKEFSSAYIIHPIILVSVTVLIVLIIEIGIRLLGVIIPMIADYKSKVIIMILFGVLLVFSAYLTTISPAKIAVKNVEYIPYQEKSEEFDLLKDIITTDQKTQNAIAEGVNKRTGAWIVVEERARAEDILLKEIEGRMIKNSEIDSLNNTIKGDTELVHNSFGFLSQVFVLFLMISGYHIKKQRDKETTTQLPKNNHATTTQPDSNQGATTTQPLRNQNATKVNVSDQLKSEILEMAVAGDLQKEIAEELNINKSTVSRVIGDHALEMYQDGVPVVTICEQLGLKEHNLTQKIRKLNIKKVSG